MKAEKKSDNGIAAQDVLDAFPGSRIIATDKPAACAHCGGGSIVFRAWPDGRREWCCSYCGREARAQLKGSM